jgi:16S rRNA (guanine527-N7)-methyltransferase
VLALRWPRTSVVLLDAHGKRTTFLAAAAEELGLGGRVEVRTARAEDAGRDPVLRSQFDVVTSRSFGSPAVTAECGAPFLQVNGLLLVAEPPGGGSQGRWPEVGLRRLGLADGGLVSAGDATVRRLRAVRRAGDEYPRVNGVPGTRPLF